jgi:hypothetical protein
LIYVREVPDAAVIMVRLRTSPDAGPDKELPASR